MRLCKKGLMVACLMVTSTQAWALDDLQVLLDNSSNAGSVEEYAKRFKRYFDNRNVDGVDGLSEEDRRIFLERETNRFLNDAEARLNKHDLDGNGIANPQEIDAVSRQAYGYQLTQELDEKKQRRVDKLVLLFLKSDVNGDGSVAMDEVLAHEQKEIDRMVAQNQMIFDAFLIGTDSDGDGIIQFSEVENALVTLLPDL